jgi:hypothetical protein
VNRWRAISVASALALTVTGCGSGTRSSQAPYALIASSSRVAAPAILGTNPQGQAVGLPRLEGSIVLVDLEVPGGLVTQIQESALRAVGFRTEARATQFLRVVENASAVRVVRGVAQGHIVSYPDSATLDLSRTAILLSAVGLPTCLLVDREGRIAARIVGLVDPARMGASLRLLDSEG